MLAEIIFLSFLFNNAVTDKDCQLYARFIKLPKEVTCCTIHVDPNEYLMLYIRCIFVLHEKRQPLKLVSFRHRPILMSPQNGIYIVYTVFFRGISNNIPPQPRHFFVLGLRSRTKKCLGFGGILLDIPLKNTVYTLHISHLGGVYI